MRVMARLFEVNYDIGDPKNRKIFQAIMEILIDPDRPGDFNQALMDLGSDIESAKNPRPDESPIRFSVQPISMEPMTNTPSNCQRKAQTCANSGFYYQKYEGWISSRKNIDGRLLGGFWTFLS